MVYLVSEIRPSDNIKQSVSGRFFGNEECLVINKHHKIEFYSVNSSSIDLITTVHLKGILHINTFRHKNLKNEALLILLRNELKVLHYDTELKFIHSVKFDKTDQNPAINPVFQIDNLYHTLIVHLFEGFIHIFTINDDFEFVKNAVNVKRVKKGPSKTNSTELFTFDTHFFDFVVIDIKVEENVIVLYRDFNYNYYIRVYSTTFQMVRQFNEFIDTPVSIIPYKNGFFVLTDNYLLFYTYKTGVTIKYSSEMGVDPASSPNCLVKKIDNFSMFNHYQIIDDERILIINNSGKSFILYINSNHSHTFMSFSAVVLIHLGLSTIPASINYFDGLFFVASKLSQSILFKINTAEPFIEILHYLCGSLPIMDIDYIHNDNMELLVCQGGYESGEFCKISNRSFYIQEDVHISLSSTGKLVSLDSGLMVVNDQSCQYIETSRLLGEKISDTNSSASGISLSPNILEVRIGGKGERLEINKTFVQYGNWTYRGPIEKYKIIDHGTFSFYSGNRIIIYHHRLIQEFNLTKEISDFDFIEVNNEFIVLVTFWDGECSVYLANDEECELIIQENLSPFHATSCSIEQLNKSECRIILVNSNNDLILKTLNFKKFTIDLTKLVYHFPGKTVKLINNGDRCILYNDKIYEFNDKVYCVDDKTGDIEDVRFFQDRLVVAYTKHLSVFKIHPSIDTVYSTMFNLKSIEVDKYSVLLSLDKSVDEYNKTYQLSLVNHRMEVLNVYQFEELLMVIDILAIPSINYDTVSVEDMKLISKINFSANSFLALCKASAKLFAIKNGKIVFLNDIRFENTDKVTFKEIKEIKVLDLDKMTFLVTGMENFLIRPKTIQVWEILPFIHKSRIYAIASGFTDDYLILGDVMKGLGVFRRRGLNFSIIRIFLATKFLSDMIINEDIICVDSYGNIQGFNMEFQQVISYNIGETINTITKIDPPVPEQDFASKFDGPKESNLALPKAIIGTNLGGIYQLSQINEETETILNQCNTELMSFKQSFGDGMNGEMVLQQDEEGEFITKPIQGIIELMMVQNWLKKDKVLSENGGEVYDDMKLSLPSCYSHKSFLQRLVFDSCL
ncbi:hypothetical protein CLIB1444_04S08152 [[Candida] jaroonii]|uniref:Uncharacterized protein n=1 Tax=[Candida] jaroonii TaxID=467808 RepID=A0ACA9Y726_9ASCO|nr:hypothetical protein CLIB1444_04S08152 [[Candida] jaroonii]